ncbi:MAG: Re/Si-specific NAD(P)(+) transhydrogenase subunit alpha [Rickettsiaceae bacterium]|nr:Re/Si-specific NAD(P)(+) transhydrogenase subunit alpha [Rickettsiaceae bacterium]
MKIVALKERVKDEQRVALTPDIVKLLVKRKHNVFVEKDIGLAANFTDSSYVEAGARISNVPLEIISDADIILKVQTSPLVGEINEINLAKTGAIIIGMMKPYENSEYITKACKKKLSLIAMEFVPRITKAQSMDVLSSQNNLAGYRAVIEACYHYDQILPMMTTAAGTIKPAKILILGVGVAGLQAIATAKRLGAIVAAYDVRPATKEQVESLGGKFIFPETKMENAEDKSGYAKELDKNFAATQEKFLSEQLVDYDIIITTAQIPGKKAPLLIKKTMIEKMKTGSIIIDMATSSGGNVEGSAIDKIVIKKGVKIIGWTNFATKLAHDSSKLYSRNLYNLLEYAISKDNKINFNDEVLKEMLITKDGKIVSKKIQGV